MSGVAQMGSPRVVTLACGHEVAYLPPLPLLHEEITCGVCGEPTEVAASPRRWMP